MKVNKYNKILKIKLRYRIFLKMTTLIIRLIIPNGFYFLW